MYKIYILLNMGIKSNQKKSVYDVYILPPSSYDESPVVHEQRVRAEFPSLYIFFFLFNMGGRNGGRQDRK